MAPREQLRAWMAARDIAPGTFARNIGYDRGNFHRMMDGAFDPSLALAHKIEIETQGAIQMSDWAEAKAA